MVHYKLYNVLSSKTIVYLNLVHRSTVCAYAVWYSLCLILLIAFNILNHIDHYRKFVFYFTLTIINIYIYPCN